MCRLDGLRRNQIHDRWVGAASRDLRPGSGCIGVCQGLERVSEESGERGVGMGFVRGAVFVGFGVACQWHVSSRRGLGVGLRPDCGCGWR
jgi:hypothetical protein